MKIITAKMKAWAIENCGIKSTAKDDEFRKAIAEAMAKSEDEDGYLSIEKYTELSTTKEDKDAGTLGDLLKNLVEKVDKLSDNNSENNSSTDDEAAKKLEEEAAKAKKEAEEKAAKEKQNKTHTPSMLEKMIARQGGFPDVDDEEKEFSVKVKEAADMYADTKSTLTYPEYTSKSKKHPLAGQAVKNYSDGGRVLDDPSDLDKAIAGAWAKFMVDATIKRSKTLAFMSLPQHDKELVCYALENMKWGGSSDGDICDDIKDRKLTSTEQKQLIDDAVSGGLEAAPIVFDDQVIQTPLLHGELFPLVNVVNIDRGRRIEGVITGTVTGAWGGVDDTAIALFNTAAYVTAFDTTIFRWEGAIRIGLDFLSDTPIDFGAHITAQYGERLLEDLDDVIATGDGTTQPEGIMNKAGVTTIAWGGATSIGNYESLRFGVAKPEHRSNIVNSAVFCGTETSYQRARALAVGAADARRLFGMDYSGYHIMERDYKINESMANTQVFYAILARYRMYRRRGFTMRSSTEGDTLIRRNEILLVAMARYGGQAERGAVAAVTTTAPA